MLPATVWPPRAKNSDSTGLENAEIVGRRSLYFSPRIFFAAAIDAASMNLGTLGVAPVTP